MPKKHQQRSLLTKPSPGASTSLALSRIAPANSNEPPKRTVNELLQDSRRADRQAQSSQAIQPSSSIHPTLRAVLDIPAPTPPPPRIQLRGPNRWRRIPGPPPPRSWLLNSRHSPPELKSQSSTRQGIRAAQHTSLLPNASFPLQTSLLHTTLKSLAVDWNFHVDYDHQFLAELPLALKDVLMSYIAIYNEDTRTNPLSVLFPHDGQSDEIDQVRRIDLGNAIGCWATVKQIERELVGNGFRRANNVVQPTDEAVPETWDADEASAEHEPKLMMGVDCNIRFRNLKHLSLSATPATAGTAASWQDLLSLASKLPTIVSLSLAYWPQPTYTPNASKGRYKVRNSTGSSPVVIYGGSDFYTAFDNNWREAAGILKSLSKSLYCLEWLDLTGCGEWLPALTWRPDEDGDNIAIGPDWNGSWRRLAHLVMSVGWKPCYKGRDREVDRDLPEIMHEDNTRDRIPGRAVDVPMELTLVRLGLSSPPVTQESESWNVEEEQEKYLHRKEVERFMELSYCAKKVAQDLRIIRKEGGGKWIEVDFGQDDLDAVNQSQPVAIS